MNIKYTVDQTVFHIENNEINPCTIVSFNVDKDGLKYTIKTPTKTLITTEDKLLEKITNDVQYNDNNVYYLDPIGIRDGEFKSDTRYNNYYDYYDYCNVYHIDKAEISILRKQNEVSCIDFDAQLIGTIPTSILPKVGIKIPSVKDRSFFKVKDRELAQLQVEFNDVLKRMMVLEFMTPKINIEKINIRQIYYNVLDNIILKLNPDIRTKTYLSMDNVDEISNLTICDGYALNKSYLITTQDKPETINYFGLSNVKVNLTEIDKITFTDTNVLPNYTIYKIDTMDDIEIHKLDAFVNSNLTSSIKNITEHIKSSSVDDAIQSLLYGNYGNEQTVLLNLFKVITPESFEKLNNQHTNWQQL